MKKEKAVVFTVSKNLAFAIACVMMDFKRLMPDLGADFIVIHDGIKQKDQRLISSILPTRFIEYQMPFDDISFIPDSILDYFTKMVFAKFECLKLLNEYKSVMLSDYDMVIQQDTSELFDYCEGGFKFMYGGIETTGQLHYPVDDYYMTSKGMSACLFVLQDHIGDYNAMYDFCYASLRKYAKALYMPEQAIFDFMIQEFNLTICEIETKVYSPHPTDSENAPNAKIIHAYGQPKFWNGLENEQWNSNYKVWLEMGGTAYKKPTFFSRVVKKLKKIIKKEK